VDKSEYGVAIRNKKFVLEVEVAWARKTDLILGIANSFSGARLTVLRSLSP
jgi:hypothetical protein